MTIVMSLVFQLLGVFDLLLLVYCIMSWIPMPPNQLMVVLRRFMEPVLEPFRRLLRRFLPISWQVVDLSPIAAWIVLAIIRKLLGLLL